MLILAIGTNLLLLAYYKYTNFFIATISSVVDAQWKISEIILPLGISFFTFTQIAFLVDTYRGDAKEYRLLNYILFVTYFPHLIAGPILHHKEIMPQFERLSTYRPDYKNLATGLTVFTFGLFKKVIIADSVALYVAPVFTAAGNGTPISFFAAWCGAFAYAFQIYFDFSGYSDMAIGISLMFGIRLPINFNSPYKATNIVEFWRRWHMTLSRFLRDYLYIPLGGNRLGKRRRFLNIMVTMLLGGLWHGAGWTFVIWGGLHGVYLLINHAWRALRARLGSDLNKATRAGKAFSRGLTFIAVVIAWVFFRASHLNDAINVLKGMCGFNGFALPRWYADVILRDTALLPVLKKLGWWIPLRGFLLGFLMILLFIVWYTPNTQQLIGEEVNYNYAEGKIWDLKWGMMILTGFAFFISIIGIISEAPSEFLYYQF